MDERKKSKTKIIIIILLVFVLILAALGGAYFYYQYNENEVQKTIEEISTKNNNALKELNEKAEYGYEISYEQLLNELVDLEKLEENTDIKIFINDKEIMQNETFKFDKIETFKFKVLLSHVYNYKIITDFSKTIENEKESQIVVEDTKMPIISGVSNKEITVGDTINLLEGITAQDEVDGQLEVVVAEGSVDNTKAGEYTIKVSATDKNGNVTEQEFKVTVKEKPKEVAKNTTSSSNKNNNTTSSSNKNTNSSTGKTNTGTSSQANNSTTPSTSPSTSADDASTKKGRENIAKKEAKKVAAQIFKPGMTDLQKAEAIAQWLYVNVEPQHNQGTEEYKTNFGNEAYAAFVLRIAACSGFCKAAIMLCNEAGLQCKHINANQWTHQWLEVYIDGRWVEMDAQLGAVFY